MSEQNYRTIGALCGLTVGIGVMLGLGFSGVLPGAVFGAGGCVCGGMIAESVYRWNQKRGN
ncbi:MAG: hypothetical protein ACR2NZ_12320 [Rubripirellula sp.]